MSYVSYLSRKYNILNRPCLKILLSFFGGLKGLSLLNQSNFLRLLSTKSPPRGTLAISVSMEMKMKMKMMICCSVHVNQARAVALKNSTTACIARIGPILGTPKASSEKKTHPKSSIR